MGYIAHHAVVATGDDDRFAETTKSKVNALKEEMPENLRNLVVGPIEGATNFYVSYCFLPDGSKEGWETSNDGDEWRDKFVGLFNDRWDVVVIRFGGDDREYLTAKDNVGYVAKVAAFTKE